MREDSWNTSEFCLRAANDYGLYMQAVDVIRKRRRAGRNPYAVNNMRVWASQVATCYSPKLRVTDIAIRRALEACDPGIDLVKR